MFSIDFDGSYLRDPFGVFSEISFLHCKKEFVFDLGELQWTFGCEGMVRNKQEFIKFA